MWRRARLSRQDVFDVVMAFGAFALAFVQVYGFGVADPGRGSGPMVGLIAFQTLPIIARRGAPLPVLGVVFAADLAPLLPPFGRPSTDLASASLFTLLVAIYTVTAHLPRRTALAAAAAVPLSVIAAMVATRRPPEDFGWLLISIVVPIAAVALAGGYIRERRIDAQALVHRATALEAERDEGARRAAAAERGRIARELHDVVAHSMSVMVVQAGAARRIIADDPERAREALRSIEVTGRDALAEMRRLLGVLRREEREDATLAPQPGLAQLPALVRRFTDAGLTVDFSVDPGGRALPPGADLSAYRIVQEALTNTLKHANATRARVAVRADADGVEVEVTDDGRGATARAEADGKGLIGMRERVAFFGGDFRAGPRPGGGFAVWVRFPLPE